jgi:hypothetical protein
MNADTDHTTRPGTPEERDRNVSADAECFASVLQVVPALGSGGDVH